jgi:dihydrofolate synthase/folylpolyglutamate synthase
MTYQQALDFIFGFVDYEKHARFSYDAATLNLSRMYQVLSLLGNPHREFQAVHIAGTKGKGSTAAMTESILRSAGFRTGLYTSPHLHTFRERIRVGGKLLFQDQLVSLVERCRQPIESVQGITTFEIITALGFLHFADEEVEWAVLETGLGGRLDATNVVMPQVTAITTLSYDHTYLLGDTLALIAAEKAGIIKHGVPLVCAPQPRDALNVIEDVCQERDSDLVLLSRDWDWDKQGADFDGQFLSVSASGREAAGRSYEGLHIPLLGDHQLLNATMAVVLVETLRQQGVDVPPEAVRRGLSSVRWPGRLEVLQQDPFLLADGAHNPDSIAKLRATLVEHFPHDRLLVVLGASEDKDTESMLDALMPATEVMISTRARHPRAADARNLAQQAAARLRPGQILMVSESVARAVEQALSMAQPEDLVCGTGSLFVAAEVREAMCDVLPADDWVHQAEPVPTVH